MKLVIKYMLFLWVMSSIIAILAQSYIIAAFFVVMCLILLMALKEENEKHC